MLSGHTHGGQVVLPVVGALAAEKFPVVAGIGRRDRTTMFVSRAWERSTCRCGSIVRRRSRC